MCLYPKLIKNRKYTETKKNKGIIPVADDARVLLVPVGCGKCMECMAMKARNWKVRLAEEIRHDNTGKFITLTFSTESLIEIKEKGKITSTGYDRDNDIAKQAVRWFLERWRKKYKVSVKHWFVTEIGGNNYESMHMHGIIWTKESNETISEIWKYGGITIGKRLYINGKAENENPTGYVNEETISYIGKYVTKTDEKHKEYQPRILSSPGIGAGYLNRLDAQSNKYTKYSETNESYTQRNGTKLALPIYYRNKIYTEEQREKLWLQKLDKNVRYILGQEISIEKDETAYYKALNKARLKNQRLGYGNDEKNWQKKQYENERRNIKFKERIEKKTLMDEAKKGFIHSGRKRRNKQQHV